MCEQMLSVSEFPQFRPQNDVIPDDLKLLENSEFLPTNFYPIQTPGYTVHWSEGELKVVERIGEGAKIVIELAAAEDINGGVFDTIPQHERRRNRNRIDGGLLKSLTGWFRDTLKWSKPETETVKIVQVIPLMYDKTIFDLIAVIKNHKNIFGFVRMRLLMTGSFGNVQRFDGFIPAIEGDVVKIVNWKSIIMAVNRNGEILVLNLDDVEAEWRRVISTDLCSVSDAVICEDRYKESAVLLLQQSDTVSVFDLSNNKMLSNLKLKNDKSVYGYIEGDELYVIQESNLYKIHLKGSFEIKSHFIEEKQQQCSVSYFIPWRQDLQVSALIVNIGIGGDNGCYCISVMALNGTESFIIHESEEFKSEIIVSVFVTSSLEIFLLDRLGGVKIYSGLLLNSDWSWQDKSGEIIPFEFSHWFNIFGDFPFRNFEYYKERRRSFDDTLFIDDLLSEYKISFPPTDWKSLGQACTKLKEEIILYYLLAAAAAAASNTSSSEKINSFYYNFGLTDKQVAFIETCFYADHGEVERASKIFCSRKIEEVQRNFIVPKLVKYLKKEEEEENLVLFSLYSAGRLISIDLLINDENTMNLMLESILNGRGVAVALEWIKGLFAWLRPDDRCALIPVADLHQKLVKRIVNVLLSHPSNAKFKSLGNDFVESQFDPDTLRSILKHLDGCDGDRAAWMITMICASRGRLHGYLLEYDFGMMVRDEEVLKGIEGIKAILRPLCGDGVDDHDSNSKASSDSGHFIHNTCNSYSSPLVIPGTPQNRSYASLKSISYSPKSPTRSQLVNVYARTPSSPQPIYDSPNSPTFTPKHYPSKKPTTLSSSNLRKSIVEVEEEESDPFKNDLIKLSGKRRLRDELQELKPVEIVVGSGNETAVILTKGDSDLKFESVIEIQGCKRKSKRRRRD